MRIAILSTFPPRQCGIATFTADLAESLAAAPGVEQVEIIAVTDGRSDLDPNSVLTTITQSVRSEYRLAARLVGRLGIDIVVVQHEFGIFGGRDGEYVLSFTSELAVPYVVTPHTVLSSPSAGQDRILRELCRRAAAVTVFTETAREMLVERGTTRRACVHVVPHGAPPQITTVAGAMKTTRVMPIEGRAGVGPADTSGRFVLSTFGLVSPGKGIETALEAVAKIVPRHPAVLLVVAGRTHPEVVRRDGEAYRLSLYQRVRELDLGDHVTFDDRFLTIDEVAELLAATDVFLTPYRGAEQAVSGALTFALAAGRPVVSTPFRYAEDLLSSGAGTLVPFGDSATLAEAVISLIEQPARLAEMRHAARRVGAALSWPAVGRATATILRDAMTAGCLPEPPLVVEHVMPPLRLDHLRALVDDVGIVQHATGNVPNRSTGYCVDDVARLVPVARRLAVRTGDPDWAAITTRGLAFLDHAAAPDGRAGMHNVMAYDRVWLDHPHHGDHVGRSMWAMCDLLIDNLSATLRAWTTAMIDRFCDGLERAQPSPRTMAYAMVGLGRLEEVDGSQQRWRALLEHFAHALADLYQQHRDDGWVWFEPYLAYDNARLSQAAVVAGLRLDRDELVDIGLRTLAWYGERCSLGDPPVRLPGNVGLYSGRRFGSGDEQPIDATALVEAEIDALRATGDVEHGRRAFAAFGWFTGSNRAGTAVYDPTTGGCCDGLAFDHVNVNQGAESTLSYFLARLALEDAGLPVVARHHMPT